MAKYRHKVFEMFDFYDEAVRALKPKIASPATAAVVSASWDLQFLDATWSDNVTHIRFRETQASDDDAVTVFLKDLAQLTSNLAIDSKFLFDFTGLSSFSNSSIDALVTFNENLRHRGGKMVLCCLEPDVRDSFFAARNP